jgi:hypothetical protein
MACAALTNNLSKMKAEPGKVAATGMRVNMELTNETYVPFLGDMNFTMNSKNKRNMVEKDPTKYRGANVTTEMTEETRAFLTDLHGKVIAELSNNLKMLPIQEVNTHQTFKTLKNWKRTFNKKVHVSISPYRYPHMASALIGGSKTEDGLTAMFNDLGLVAGINLAYSFVAFHEQSGVAAVELTDVGAAPRSIGLSLKLQGRDATGGIMLNQEFVAKSDAIALPAYGKIVNYTDASKQYEQASQRLIEAIREHFGTAS